MQTQNFRLHAVGLHLLGSVLVAAVAWWLVFHQWYPAPLSVLAGGAELFTLVMVVDLVLGPALTAVIANPKKSPREFARDIGVILVIQVAALVYGLQAVAVARPAAIAFEVDLFRLVAANEIETDQLHLAPPALQQLPWNGPVTLAAIKPSDSQELFDTIQLGLAGIHLAHLPKYWRTYASQQSQVWEAARPADDTLLKHPVHGAALTRAAAQAGLRAETLRTLPLLSRKAEGTVLLAPPDARIVGILPVALAP